MASRSFEPNFAGYREILRSEPGLRALIEAETSAAAAEVRANVPPRITRYVLNGVLQTDRAQGNITIAIPGASAMEAKHGYLSHAVGPIRRR